MKPGLTFNLLNFLRGFMEIQRSLNEPMIDGEVIGRIKPIGERLRRKYKAQRVILFGSYARGEAGENSDIDLLVIAPTKERSFERMATVWKH